MTPTIIILALIAAFLGLRLYSVLGKHGSDGESIIPRGEERPRTAPAGPAILVNDAPRPQAPVSGGGLVYEPAADLGIRAILSAERGFDVGRFLSGSRAAYRQILEAYWSGDRSELRNLCDADSAQSFIDAIDAREARGETLENRLVVIDRAIITDAGIVAGQARITVRFDADIAAITRDKDGKIIAGSMTDAVAQQDVWSFVRTVGDKDPNWLLDETDAG